MIRQIVLQCAGKSNFNPTHKTSLDESTQTKMAARKRKPWFVPLRLDAARKTRYGWILGLSSTSQELPQTAIFFLKSKFFEQTTCLIRRLKIDSWVADFRRLLHKDARTTGSEAARCVSAFHHTQLSSEGFRLSWKTHQCSTLFSFIFLFLSFLLTPNLIPHLCLCLQLPFPLQDCFPSRANRK